MSETWGTWVVAVVENGQRQVQKQIPCGNDNKVQGQRYGESNDNGKGTDTARATARATTNTGAFAALRMTGVWVSGKNVGIRGMRRWVDVL